MRINLFLDEVEEKNLKALLEKFGGKAPEYLRSLLRGAYAKAFPSYMENKPKLISGIEEPELTQEQMCEAVGGKIVTENGIPTCTIAISKNMTRSIPLSLLGSGQFTVEKLKQKP